MLAFQPIFNKSKRKPKKLWTDEGTEFNNKTFMNFIEDNRITLYSTVMKEKRLLLSILFAL